MRYGSVCSGIEAATVAWHGLGWEPAFFSEIESFPCQVLSHHYADVPLHGDFTTIGDEYGSIDLLVGGTPCQSFSIAGLRKGLDDERGNLALEYLKLAQRKRPRWLVWENVPGVLSSNGGRDFGAFLGGLVELGYGFAYRILDAQYFGVSQRRRRVFVVGYLGDWRRAAAVLFERESLSGNPAPSRKKGEKPAPAVISGPPFSRTGNERVECDAYIPISAKKCWPVDVAPTLNAAFGTKQGLEDQHALGGAGHFVPDVMGTITARMFNALGARDVEEGAVIPFSAFNQSIEQDISQTVASRADQDTAFCVAFQSNANAGDAAAAGDDICPTMRHDSPAVATSMAVRRLTPIECERLQGFPDNYTNIKEKCPDGPRYKALGNSMAVPVMKWIGERIKQVEGL